MINIVIPMAGAGSRFVKAGYKTPKPFIDVLGKPMIQRVLKNLSYPDARYILVMQKKHIKTNSKLIKKLKKEFNLIIIPIDILTEGTVSTVLFAHRYINNTTPLLIANSDQLINMDIADYINDCKKRKLDGSILTFIDKSRDTKWSFAKIGKDKLVTQVKEKVAISDYATVGIYYFSKGKEFVNSAIDMIIEKDRVNGEFYTCPVYNYLIRDKGCIGIYNIKFTQMHGLGTPDDLNKYIAKKRLESTTS